MIKVINEDSYRKALIAIYNRLKSLGYNVRITDKHRCVTVYDNNDNPIEQHYPEELPDTCSTRNKFIKVGQGNGSYELQRVDYVKHNYTDNGKNYVKYISGTNEER